MTVFLWSSLLVESTSACHEEKLLFQEKLSRSHERCYGRSSCVGHLATRSYSCEEIRSRDGRTMSVCSGYSGEGSPWQRPCFSHKEYRRRPGQVELLHSMNTHRDDAQRMRCAYESNVREKPSERESRLRSLYSLCVCILPSSIPSCEPLRCHSLSNER